MDRLLVIVAVVPEGSIALGEVQPGEAIEKTAEVKMMAGGTVAAIVAAGLVDGFNPCAFSIIIGLAGVLAVGSHTRKARMLAGWGG